MNLDSTIFVVALLLIAALSLLIALLDRRWSAQPFIATEDGRAISRTRHTCDVLVVAVCFALVTAALQITLIGINRIVRDRFVMVGPQFLWMTPLAYGLIFIGLCLLPVLLLWVSPRLVSIRLVVGGFAWLSIFSMLLPFVQIHRFASAILAAGVAIQAARIIGRRPGRWLRMMPRVSWTIAASVVVVVLGLQGWRLAAERWALARLPAARAGAPNVLLVVMDTVRAENLSLYGYSRRTTPELERWSHDGTTFDLAFSTAPWTLTSHASMFTGLYPGEIVGDVERPVGANSPMLAEIFRDQGYATGGFVGNLSYTSRESGLARGFTHYDDYHVSARQVLLHSWLAHTPLFLGLVHSRSFGDVLGALRHASVDFDPNTFSRRTYERPSATEINSSFLDWQATTAGRPFFAFLNYFDAHSPYAAPSPFAERFALPERRNLGRYDGAVAYLDQEIGRLLGELQRRGVLDNTIVIVTADHGEQFGEHGLVQHGNSLYLPLLRVPLFVRYPARVAKGVRVTATVTLRDLAATVIDLAGLTQRAHLPGTSLAAEWDADRGTQSDSAIVAEVERAIRPDPNTPIAYGPMRSVIDGRFHYIRRGDGFEELYDFSTDAAEARNLSETPDGMQELARIRALLDR